MNLACTLSTVAQIQSTVRLPCTLVLKSGKITHRPGVTLLAATMIGAPSRFLKVGDTKAFVQQFVQKIEPCTSSGHLGASLAKKHMLPPIFQNNRVNK